MNAPIIDLSITDVLAVHFDRFKMLISGTVTPEEALAKTLERFANEIAVQREETKAAWAEMAKYKHPQRGTGIISDLEQRLHRYNAEGERDGAEMLEIQARLATSTSLRGDKARQVTLQDELQKDAANVQVVTGQLSGAEALLKKWTQRYEERNKRLTEMKDEYNALQSEGPAWLAQIRDSQKAEAADTADANKTSSTITDARNLRANLQSQAEMATLREEAGREIDDEAPSLDDQIAARESLMANNSLISGWLKKN